MEEDIQHIVNRDYLIRYKKKCDRLCILAVVFDIVVMFLLQVMLYYVVNTTMLMHITSFIICIIVGLPYIKNYCYNSYNVLIQQLNNEYTKIKSLGQYSVYSIIKNKDSLRVWFSCNDLDYCLAIEDYVVIMQDYHKEEESAII